MITQPVKRTTWHYESSYNGSSVGHRGWSFQHTAQCFDWNILQTRHGMTNLHLSPFLYKFCLSINFRTTTLTNRICLVFRGHAGRSICTAQGVAVWRRCTHLLHRSIHLITGNAGAYALCNLPRIRLLSISASSRSQINLASLSSGSGS